MHNVRPPRVVAHEIEPDEGVDDLALLALLARGDEAVDLARELGQLGRGEGGREVYENAWHAKVVL